MKKYAQYIGGDISTGSLTLFVRDDVGAESSLSWPMEGATTWHGGAAFDVNYLPYMLVGMLAQFEQDGWSFENPGHLVFSVRQHDLVLVDEDYRVRQPALSWECNQAAYHTRSLNDNLTVSKIVGRIEQRFILPKAAWALTVEPRLMALRYVMTTGDWLAGRLTGRWYLSTSDAISNGLLNQQSKVLSHSAIAAAGLMSEWFPAPINSDYCVGEVMDLSHDRGVWRLLKQKLVGWNVGACLGDNHASAVSCLDENDSKTMVASFGTSGTTVCSCDPTAELTGQAACFEFFDQRLLLCMVPRCARWYDDFLQTHLPENVRDNHSHLDMAAHVAVTSGELPHFGLPFISSDGTREHYPSGNWNDLPNGQKVAAVQLSVVVHMLRDARVLLKEVQNRLDEISTCVLVGGLSQSRLVQAAYQAGLDIVTGVEGAIVAHVSTREGSAAQGAAYGALITAMGHARDGDRASVLAELCPTRPCYQPDKESRDFLNDWLREHLHV